MRVDICHEFGGGAIRYYTHVSLRDSLKNRTPVLSFGSLSIDGYACRRSSATFDVELQILKPGRLVKIQYEITDGDSDPDGCACTWCTTHAERQADCAVLCFPDPQ